MPAAEKPPVLFQPLDSHHNRAVFSCGVDALDRYLRHQAGQDIRKHVAITFVVVEADNPEVLGFYTLSATSVRLSDLPESTTKSLPRYPLVPAILLGRLAVDQRQRGKGYGELLLVDALQRCLRTKDIGWAVVVVGDGHRPSPLSTSAFQDQVSDRHVLKAERKCTSWRPKSVPLGTKVNPRDRGCPAACFLLSAAHRRGF